MPVWAAPAALAALPTLTLNVVSVPTLAALVVAESWPAALTCAAEAVLLF
jgi:hypothetical protein